MPEKTLVVRVLLFARARELAGKHRDSIELPAPATVADARTALRERYPRLGPLIERSRIAVNEEFAEPETELEDGSELAVIPPVSGG